MKLLAALQAERSRRRIGQPERGRPVSRPEPRRFKRNRPERKGPDRRSGPFLIAGIRQTVRERMAGR